MTAADVLYFAAIVLGVAFMAIGSWQMRAVRKMDVIIKDIERDLALMDGRNES